MSNPTVYPLVAFSFSVEICMPAGGGPACSAAFAECDGLEMTMEVKRIREGGNNDVHVVVPGPTSYGQLTLKRGMTDCFDLWKWFRAVQEQPKLRASTTVALLSASVPAGASARTPSVQFLLSGCVPIKLKAPALNAVNGMVAIEELQIAYASLQRKGA